MTSQSSQRLPELLFYTKKPYRILQAPIPAPIPAPILHVHITLQSREFSIQNPILHTEDRALRVLLLHSRGQRDLHSRKENSMHRRQGDLLEMHPCVLHDIPVTPVAPETFQTFQSFMTFQPLQAILQCSSISRESTPFQHSPIRMHILQFDWFPQKTPPSTSWAITDITNIHSFFKEREMLRYRSN